MISTRDDYYNFGKGIAQNFENPLRGYMDFGGLRGLEALSGPYLAIELPNVSSGRNVDNLIIAKSVLASGCTAIALAQKAIEKYRPKNIIIASIFYSEVGIREVLRDIYPTPSIIVVGEPDELNADGFLSPGVGNLDERMSL